MRLWHWHSQNSRTVIYLQGTVSGFLAVYYQAFDWLTALHRHSSIHFCTAVLSRYTYRAGPVRDLLSLFRQFLRPAPIIWWNLLAHRLSSSSSSVLDARFNFVYYLRSESVANSLTSRPIRFVQDLQFAIHSAERKIVPDSSIVRNRYLLGNFPLHRLSHLSFTHHVRQAERISLAVLRLFLANQCLVFQRALFFLTDTDESIYSYIFYSLEV